MPIGRVTRQAKTMRAMVHRSFSLGIKSRFFSVIERLLADKEGVGVAFASAIAHIQPVLTLSE